MISRKILVPILFFMYPVILLSATPEERGLEIAKEADRRDLGWRDSTAKLIMVLRNRQGDESRREIRTKNLEIQNDGDKSLTIFDKPADVRGTAMLTFSHELKPDDQWLYLPALKRVKRITSKNKSGPFMGSEFAYEDISSQEVGKYSYKYIKEENVNGLDCFVIERYPSYEYSAYTKQIAWIDKAHFRIQKIDYYDRKNSMLKTLMNSKYKVYLDKYWRPSEMFMQNHQTQKSTKLIWTDYKFKSGIKESEFNKNSLKRAR